MAMKKCTHFVEAEKPYDKECDYLIYRESDSSYYMAKWKGGLKHGMWYITGVHPEAIKNNSKNITVFHIAGVIPLKDLSKDVVMFTIV